MFYEAMEWFRQFLIKLVTAIWEFIVLSSLSVYYITESIILSLTPSFLRTLKNVRGKVVVITGGAGGVGQELAIKLAKLKAKVVVWDVDEKAMEKLKDRMESQKLMVHTYVVDVTDRKNVYKNADLVKHDLGPVDILINNAGVVAGSTFMENSDENIEKTFQVNTLSHYWTIKAFLGDMMRRGRGHIVSVGSLTGMLGTYKCTEYSASKYALTGLHESLLTELKTHGHDNINMTLVYPYFINTRMFVGCKPRSMAMLEPKDVAARVILAMRRDEVFVTMPASAKFILPLKNYIPAKLNWAVMYRVIQGPQSMMGLKPQQEYQEAIAA